MMRTANTIKMFSMTHSTWNTENRIQLLIDSGMLSRAAQTAFAGRTKRIRGPHAARGPYVVQAWVELKHLHNTQ